MTEHPANPYWGSTLDEFLDEEGIRDEATTAAIKRVIAWQLAEEMRRRASSRSDSPI
jgi:antitoxin HicB